MNHLGAVFIHQHLWDAAQIHKSMCATTAVQDRPHWQYL